MADIATLGIRVTTQGVRQAETDLGRLSKEAASAERASVKLGSSIGRYLGIGLTAVVGGGIAAIISSTIEAEKAQAQLQAVLRSTGGAAGLSAAELNKMADSLQALSTYDDEAITGAQSLLLTFTKIGRDVFPSATKAVLDMSTALGTDLKSSALQIGKALQDPERGMTALTRAGVSFSEAQKDTVKALVDTGREADAQRLILRELETQFGGSAQAARNTLGGALQALKNDFANLLEGDSGSDGIKGTTAAINSLGETMRSQSVKDGFATIISGLAKVAEFAFKATAALTGNTEAARQNGLANAQKSYIGLLQRRFQIEDALGKNFLQRRAEDAFTSDADLKAELKRIGVLEERLRNAERRANAPVAGGRAAPRVDQNSVGADVKKLADKLREEAAAYGLARSAALELERAKALGNATTDAEKKAINGAYDALIRKVKAGEAEAAGKRGAADAARRAAEIERDAKRTTEERTRAARDFTTALEDLRAEQDGPLAESNLAFDRQQQRLNELAETGAISAEKLAEATALLGAQRGEATDEIKKQLDPIGQLILAKEKELELAEMSEAAYRTAIDLRGLEAEATEELRAKVEALNQALIDQEKLSSALDDVRQSFADNFADVITGAKSAKDAFKDFADSIIQQIARILAQRAAAALFGDMGTTQTGSAGGLLGSLFSSLLGGGRAVGGPVSAGRLYEVNERGRPEVFHANGRSWMLPTANGTVGQAAPATTRGPAIGAMTINVPAGTDRESAGRIATRVGQAVEAAMARNR